MAVIEYDEYKQKLQALEPTLGELEKALGIPKAREELAELQKETEQEGFWNDLERSQQVSRQVKRLENKIKKHDKLVSEWEDTLTLCEMAQEEDDPSQLEEVVSGYETLEKEIETLKTNNDALETRIETSVDLDYVYQVATEELGMVYANKDQVRLYNKTESEYVRQYEDIPKH